jgi:hypothetical protein
VGRAMAKTDRKQVRKRLAWLKAKFPSAYPIRCMIRPAKSMGDMWAHCEMLGTPGVDARFVIRLRDDRTYDEIEDDLRHEYAHVLHMHIPNSVVSHHHDPIYSAIQGMIYSYYHEEIE